MSDLGPYRTPAKPVKVQRGPWLARMRVALAGLELGAGAAILCWSASEPARTMHTPTSMTLLALVVALVVAGVLLWAVGQLPIDATVQKIIRVVVIVVLVLWVVSSLFGHALGGANVRLW